MTGGYEGELTAALRGGDMGAVLKAEETLLRLGRDTEALRSGQAREMYAQVRPVLESVRDADFASRSLAVDRAFSPFLASLDNEAVDEMTNALMEGGEVEQLGPLGGNLYAAAANIQTDAVPPAANAQPNAAANAQATDNRPMGIRNNNPGNLETLPSDHWQGQTGEYNPNNRRRAFAVFDTPENGLRAMAVNIISQQVIHERNNVADIISVWAPPTDNNPTTAYANRVAHDLNVDVNQTIDTRDPVVLQGLMRAIIMHENGNQNPYTDAQIETAANTAIEYHNQRRR